MQPWLDVGGGVRVTGDGAAWVPAERTVVVADVHLGYELAAQRRGGWLPRVETGREIGARLAAIATALGAERLVIAGDLRHSTRDVDAMERAELHALAQAVREQVSVEVVLGNHDRGGALVDLPAAAMVRVGAVDVVHHPPRAIPQRWTICGHLHPRVTVRDDAGASARYPCAMVGPRTVVLPAWSDWAGGIEVRRLLAELPEGSWRVLPMTGGQVADLGIELPTGSG